MHSHRVLHSNCGENDAKNERVYYNVLCSSKHICAHEKMEQKLKWKKKKKSFWTQVTQDSRYQKLTED